MAARQVVGVDLTVPLMVQRKGSQTGVPPSVPSTVRSTVDLTVDGTDDGNDDGRDVVDHLLHLVHRRGFEVQLLHFFICTNPKSQYILLTEALKFESFCK